MDKMDFVSASKTTMKNSPLERERCTLERRNKKTSSSSEKSAKSRRIAGVATSSRERRCSSFKSQKTDVFCVEIQKFSLLVKSIALLHASNNARCDDDTMNRPRNLYSSSSSSLSSSMWTLRNLTFLFAWFLAYAEQMFVSLLLGKKKKKKKRNRSARFGRTKFTEREEERLRRVTRDGGGRDERKIAYFVTGWSSGIGFETCLMLMRRGGQLEASETRRPVELHLPTRGGREEEEGKNVERLRTCASVDGENVKIVLAKIELDCATLAIDARARERARKYFAKNDVDVLIHCAAECNAEKKVLLHEEGGIDREAMCNVLGPAVLTKLWRDELSINDDESGDEMMKKTVVFVGSFTHRARLGVCTRTNAKEWVNRLDRCASARKEKDFETLGIRYALSKLMVTAYALGKMREEDNDDFVRIKVVDPGLCRTRLTRTWPKALRLLYEIPMRIVGLLEHPRKGAERILCAASSFEDADDEKCEKWSDAVAYSAVARDDLVQRLCVKAVDGFIAEREQA